ncbi:MAG: hypothetical protein CMJ78_20895 [Planctomycetaceae bacterium]|nr:hypothetical protein [Planctomycetaceae bacterium]
MSDVESVFHALALYKDGKITRLEVVHEIMNCLQEAPETLPQLRDMVDNDSDCLELKLWDKVEEHRRILVDRSFE